MHACAFLWPTQSGPGLLGEEDGVLDPGDDGVEIVLALEVAEEERPLAALSLGIALHHAEVGAHQRGEVYFVDDQQVAESDRRAALARDLVTLGDVDDVDERVHELGRERRGEIVPAALHEHQLQVGKLELERATGLLVHRGVVADRRVRATASLDTDDALGGQRAVADEKGGVLGAVNVVGDDSHRVTLAEALAEFETEHRLPGTNRATDADAWGTCHGEFFIAKARKVENAKKSVLVS